MKNNILVAYFSATGTTARVAKKIAEVVNGDLFAIIPVKSYTEADLDWHNQASRSSREMQDKKSRPAIANQVSNMADYDQIFLGFPIWWYQAPTIINTFLESYDLTNKIIIPFATSGGSGMGKTNDYLKVSCPQALLKEGARLKANISELEIKEWLASLK